MKNLFPAPESLSLEMVWAKNHSFGPEWRDYSSRIACASLWYVTAGKLRVEADGEKQTAHQNDWVWRAPSGARSVETGPDGASWLSVGMVAMRGGKNWFAPAHSLIFRPVAETEQRGAQLIALLTSQADIPLFERDGLARALMGWLWNVAGETVTPVYPLWLEQALQKLESEPGVSVSELARGAHFSPAQFRRLWEKHLGSAPRDTVLQRRLELARRYLENEEWSVGEIAWRSGFAGAAQLSRAFRAAFDAAPLEWRRASRDKL